MSLTTDITTALAALTGLSVYPLLLPQTPTLPALTYQVISTVRQQTHDGDSGLVVARVQVDIFALTYGEAESTAGVVVDWLKGGRPATATIEILHARINNEFDEYDALTGQYRRIVDAQLTYQET